MPKSNKFRDAVANMMEAVTLDENGETKIINQEALDRADALINEMIIESAREWWTQLESAEDSLASMSDEISFADLNADSSHIETPALAVDVPDDPAVPATMESVLGEEEFNLDSIFEMDSYDRPMMDDSGDPEMGDGDEQYDDLLRGDDEEGIGDDTPMGDDMSDEYGGDDPDAMGTDNGGDDMGDLGGDPMGGGAEEFDFSILDDEGMGDLEGGDDMGGDPMMGGDDEPMDEPMPGDPEGGEYDAFDADADNGEEPTDEMTGMVR